MPKAPISIDRGTLRGRNLRLIHAAPVVPLFVLAFIAASPIRDNSFLWHVRAGTVQLADERVILSDPFSFTRLGTPWRTQSWLIELLYAYLEGWFESLAWVNVLVFVLGALAVGLIGLSTYRMSRSPISITLVILVVIWLESPFLQPRPVLMSYVLLAALVGVLQNRDRVVWLAIPIIWIWAAMHGSWIIGGGLIVLEWIRTADRALLKAGFAALIATFLTAHGAGVWMILGDFAGAQDALALMQEWGAPDFGDIVQAPYLLFIAGIIVAGMRGKLEYRDLIVILPFMFFGMTSQRAVFPAAIVVAPWVVRALPEIDVPRSSMSATVAGAVLGVLTVLTVTPLFITPLGVLDKERFPSDEMQAAMVGFNVFHDDAVGGLLIFEKWPERLVYVDDRAELYGAGMITEHVDARKGHYERVFSRYGFDAALAHRDWPLADELDDDSWRRLAEDQEFVLFVAP